jgi:hypothetical protein
MHRRLRFTAQNPQLPFTGEAWLGPLRADPKRTAARRLPAPTNPLKAKACGPERSGWAYWPPGNEKRAPSR